MITVAITRNASNANWSCRKTPIFFGRVTEPLVGSSSPVRIFINVDLPAPLGPDTAYRRPAMNVQVTSSNSTRGPKRMDMLFTESIAFYYTVDFFIAARQMNSQFHHDDLTARHLFCMTDSRHSF